MRIIGLLMGLIFAFIVESILIKTQNNLIIYQFITKIKISLEISFNEKMVEIWQRNEEKLRKQMSGIGD